MGVHLGSEVHDGVNVLTLEDVRHQIKGLDAALHELEVWELHHGLYIVGCSTVVCTAREVEIECTWGWGEYQFMPSCALCLRSLSDAPSLSRTTICTNRPQCQPQARVVQSERELKCAALATIANFTP